MIKGLRFLLARLRRRAFSFTSWLCACLFVLTLAMAAGAAAAGAEAMAEALAGDPREFLQKKIEAVVAADADFFSEAYPIIFALNHKNQCVTA